METWRRRLVFDPVNPLVGAENAAINYFARQDLLGGAVPSAQSLWQLNEVKTLLRKQKDDGSWSHPGARLVHRPAATKRGVGIENAKDGG